MRIISLMAIIAWLLPAVSIAGTATGTISATIVQPFQVEGSSALNVSRTSAGHLSVKGLIRTQPGLMLSVTPDGRVELTKISGHETLSLTGLHSVAMLSAQADGSATLTLGGQLNISRKTLPGSYSGIVNIMVDYQ